MNVKGRWRVYDTETTVSGWGGEEIGNSSKKKTNGQMQKRYTDGMAEFVDGGGWTSMEDELELEVSEREADPVTAADDEWRS